MIKIMRYLILLITLFMKYILMVDLVFSTMEENSFWR